MCIKIPSLCRTYVDRKTGISHLSNIVKTGARYGYKFHEVSELMVLPEVGRFYDLSKNQWAEEKTVPRLDRMGHQQRYMFFESIISCVVNKVSWAVGNNRQM